MNAVVNILAFAAVVTAFALGAIAIVTLSTGQEQLNWITVLSVILLAVVGLMGTAIFLEHLKE